jgi:membrane-associated protease RseP (regulator of RpoE activity)
MWLVFALALAAPLTAVHLIAMALASAGVGAEVTELRIFFGPGITLRRERPKIVIGVLPLGGFVSCRGQTDEDVPGEPRRFDDLAAWRKVLVFLSSNVALLVIAAFLIGPGEALACAARTPLQLASLALDRSRALADVQAFAALGPSLAMMGVVAAKLAAFNLMPFATLNGWAIVRLAIPRARRAAVDRWWAGASSLIMVAMFVLGVMTLLRA